MDVAIAEGWPMEAITIQESILSGRRLSALYWKGITVNPRGSFGSLIDRYRRHAEDQDPQVEALAARLHEWRINRNETLHSVCRPIDDPYDEDTVTKFEDALINAAREGRVLVDDVRSTVERIKRSIRNAGQVS